MSITLTTPAELTLDEIEDKVTSLYYMQRVNYEAADELGAKALPLWKRLRKPTRLRDVATKPASGGTRGIYDTQHGEVTTATTAFSKTYALSALLAPGCWPEFSTDEDKSKAIEVWTELIGLSEDALDIYNLIRETGKQINALLNPRERQAQDLRGWYVAVRTSRRSTTGWVVGGRGQSLHVVQDRLAGTQRMLLHPQEHRAPVTGFAAIKAASHRIFDEYNPEVEKYSLKTATVSLLLPPDMARDRKEWVHRVIATAFAHRDTAKANWLSYVDWKAKAEPIVKRQKAAMEWAEAVPKDFRKDWVEGDGLRWAKGAKEAFSILYSLTTMNDEDLREAIKAAHVLANPELVVTEAEATFAANPPAGGADSFDVSLARTVKNGVGTVDLAPMF